MPTTIWLARHGEVHNPTGLLYGRLPRMRLSVEGERQARAVADSLAERPLHAIYSSPMLRARRTAGFILEQHPSLERVRITRDLQEVRTAWQGEPLETLEKINWDFYSNPRHPDDETLVHIHDRMHRWLERVLRRHPDGEVVGVSHGDPILILVGTLRGIPLDSPDLFPRPYIPTATVYRLTFEDPASLPEIEMLVPHAEAAA